MPMLHVLTMKVHLAVNVMLGIMELDLIVLVSIIFYLCVKHLAFTC